MKVKTIVKYADAYQYFSGVEIEGVLMSSGFKSTGIWHDRLSDEPDKPTPYILDANGKRQYIQESNWVLIEYDFYKKPICTIMRDEEFIKLYEVDDTINYNKEIVDILGKNHKTPAVFKDESMPVQAIYTFKEHVYCITYGEDISLNEYDDKSKAIILKAIQSKAYELNKFFQ